jgi:hypothetical protein
MNSPYYNSIYSFCLYIYLPIVNIHIYLAFISLLLLLTVVNKYYRLQTYLPPYL